MDPERNDVDISKLFVWSRAFEVVVDDEPLAVVYMRVLGDADINRARVFALRESAILRKKLRDLGSDERLSSIKDIEDLTIEDLINLIVLFSSRDISQRAWRDVKIPSPRQPKTDAPLEKHEKFQQEVDEYPKKREEAIRKAINNEIESLKASLAGKSKEDLYNEYVRLVIDELCEMRSLQAFREYSTYLGCYRDDGFRERFFSSFEEFDNLPTSQKSEFMSAFRELELSNGELKKLRQATP